MAQQMPKTPHLSTERLHYDAKDKTFSAEMSDLSEQLGRIPRLHQVYPDSIDLGLCLMSRVTEKITWWFLSKEEVRDGDLLYYEFQPTPEAVKECPKLSGCKMILFND